MTSHIIRRLLTAIPVMAFVALFIFGLLYLAPGDPAAIMAGDSATVQQIDQIRDALGLDKPFLVRFGEWCADLSLLDLIILYIFVGNTGREYALSGLYWLNAIISATALGRFLAYLARKFVKTE